MRQIPYILWIPIIGILIGIVWIGYPKKGSTPALPENNLEKDKLEMGLEVIEILDKVSLFGEEFYVVLRNGNIRALVGAADIPDLQNEKFVLVQSSDREKKVFRLRGEYIPLPSSALPIAPR